MLLHFGMFLEEVLGLKLHPSDGRAHHARCIVFTTAGWDPHIPYATIQSMHSKGVHPDTTNEGILKVRAQFSRLLSLDCDALAAFSVRILPILDR